MSYIFIKENKKLDVIPELWGFALPHVSKNVNFLYFYLFYVGQLFQTLTDYVNLYRYCLFKINYYLFSLFSSL